MWRRTLVGLGLCGPSIAPATGARAEASAGVVASARADLDGDRRDDLVTLGADGMLRVTSRGDRAVEVALGAFAEARVEVTGSSPRFIVVAGRTTGGVQEGVLLRWLPGAGKPALELRWRGALGPVGLDGEYAQDVSATPAGALRFQTRADIRRCDGQPARLFVEGWDDAQGSFRKVRGNVALPVGTPTITATLADASVATSSVSFRAAVASTGLGARDAGALAPPSELDDGDPTTAWREGTGSDGRGEFITFQPRLEGAEARALVIVPGATASAARVTRLAVVGAGGAAAWIDVPTAGDPTQAYLATLPAPIAGCVTVLIAATQPATGDKVGSGTTAIADLAILGEPDLTPGGALPALIERVVAGGSDATAAATALARRPAALAPIAARVETLASSDAEADRAATLRLLRVVLAGAAGAPDAAALLRAHLDRLAGAELAGALDAIATSAGGPGAIASVVVQPDADPDTVIGALTWLKSHSGTAAALLSLLDGAALPDALETDLSTALARTPLDELLAARAEARLAWWRALALAGAGPDVTGAQRAALIELLVSALAQPASYPIRAWQARGVAALGDAAAVATLVRVLAALPSGAERAALETMVAEALGRNRSSHGLAALREAIASPDAGVRLAAIDALRTLRDDGAGAPAPGGPWTTTDASASADAIDRLIGGPLAADAWTDVRQRAAEALAPRCQHPDPAARLTERALEDTADAVRTAALAALVGCRAPGIGPLLLRVATDTAAPLRARTSAIGLIPALGDHTLHAPLSKAFAGWRRGALDLADALPLAVRAAASIGKLGAPGAGDVLIDALADGAVPELVAAAALGLGELGPACPARALPLLEQLTTSGSAEIATAAREAVRRIKAPPAMPTLDD
jgi:hypothetical protein